MKWKAYPCLSELLSELFQKKLEIQIFMCNLFIFLVN